MSDRPLTFASPGRFEITSHYSAPIAYPEESHQTVQVCVPLDGARYRVVRRSETGRPIVHDLGAGDVLVVPAGQPHAVTWHRPAGIVSLQLAEVFVQEALDVSRLQLGDTCTIRDPFMTAAARALRTTLESEGRVSPAYGEALAVAIAYRAGAGAAQGRIRVVERVGTLASRQLSRIDRYIDERLDQPIVLADLARLAGLSKWHFVRRFHASLGYTPHEHVTRRRMARAETLLATSGLSITEIALEIGMSHSHFSRTFIHRLGVTPRDYRRERQESA